MLCDDRVTFDGKEANNLVFEHDTNRFCLKKMVSLLTDWHIVNVVFINQFLNKSCANFCYLT